MSEKCVLHALSDRTMTVGGLLDCTQAYKQTRCFQHYALTVVDLYRQGIQHNQIFRFFPASDLNHETIFCSCVQLNCSVVSGEQQVC